MKKLPIIALLVGILTTSLYASPAGAAMVKNGVNCAKLGATMKVGSKSYRCAKNPYVKSTRLTWTLRECLTAYSMWKNAKQQFEDWVDLAKLAGVEGQKTMDELQGSILELEAIMKDNVCKRGA